MFLHFEPNFKQFALIWIVIEFWMPQTSSSNYNWKLKRPNEKISFVSSKHLRCTYLRITHKCIFKLFLITIWQLIYVFPIHLHTNGRTCISELSVLNRNKNIKGWEVPLCHYYYELNKSLNYFHSNLFPNNQNGKSIERFRKTAVVIFFVVENSNHLGILYSIPNAQPNQISIFTFHGKDYYIFWLEAYKIDYYFFYDKPRNQFGPKFKRNKKIQNYTKPFFSSLFHHLQVR